MKTSTIVLLAILAALALAGTGGAILMNTRGFRNKNPGNLKGNVAWLGRVGTDPQGFAIFESMEMGVRAIRVDLTAKLNRGVDTVRKIISVYAPSIENPTENYIRKVSEWSGVSPDQKLTAANLPAIVDSIIRFENGGALQAAVIKAGLALA